MEKRGAKVTAVRSVDALAGAKTVFCWCWGFSCPRTDINMYLNRTFCPQHEKPTIYDSGMVLFREIVLQQHGIQSLLDEALSTVLSHVLRGTVQEACLVETVDRLKDMISHCCHHKGGDDRWLQRGVAAAIVAAVGEDLKAIETACAQQPPGDLDYWCYICNRMAHTYVNTSFTT